MKRAILVFLGILLALPLGAVSVDGSLQAVNLRCEYKVNPDGIGDTIPRLSWELSSLRRNMSQSAYRVIAASGLDALARDEGDLWDSGKVASGESIQIEYAGKPLSSGQKVFWKVMVWDLDGAASKWSENASWGMGLLNPGDWKGEWIGKDTPPGEIHTMTLHLPPPISFNLRLPLPAPYALEKLTRGKTAKFYLPAPYLRKEFTAKDFVKRATLYATALGLYEISINGDRVGLDYFTPGWTDYNKRIQYQTYDVTGLIGKGENAIGAILADGWWAGNIGLKGQRYYGSTLRLKAQLVLEYADGTKDIIVTDDSWKASRGPIREADIQAGEVYDARLEMEGWSEAGFDDKGWEPVDKGGAPDVPLEAYPGIPVRKTVQIKPVSITEPKPNVYVFDMGQNFAGFVRVIVSGDRGDKITLRFAEMLKADGNVYTINLRSARATDTYILKGGGVEYWEPRFTYHGFQYVEVTGWPGKPDLDSITGVAVHNDLPVTGAIETSHPLVNKLFGNIFWGQRSNYIEAPTDCPQRDERLGWTGDAQVFVRTATYNMDVAPFFTKWITDLMDGQNANGAFPDVAPNVTGGVAAGWGDAGIVCPWTILRVYGDKRLIARHYDAMARYIAFLEGRSKDYLSPPLGTYGDWLNIKDPTPLDLIATAYYGFSASLMADMAAELGKDEDAKRYRELFANIQKAFTEKFVDADGKVKGDSQTAYLLALKFNLVPADLREKVAANLVRKIEERDYSLSTGFLGLRLLLPTLTDIGRTDLAYRLLVNRKYPSWGYSIDQGATTVWERWNSYTKESGFGDPGMNSFNHYAFGSVGEWMYMTMAGIDTSSLSFKKIIIRPRPGNEVTWVKASYHSIRGPIKVEWKKDGDVFKLDLEIPANTTAEVHFPIKGGITESGNPIESNDGVLEIGSGSYSFLVNR